MQSVLLTEETFDIKNVLFQKNINRLSNGSKYIGINYSKKILTLETPYMGVPFGGNINDKYDIVKYNMDLSFDNLDNTKVKKFYNKLVKLDKKIIEEGIKNSLTWFKIADGKKSVIKELYNKQIKVSKDKDGKVLDTYPPRLRVKLPFENNKFNFEILDKDDKVIEKDLLDILKKGSKVKCILQCVGLWISNNSYSCQWKVNKINIESIIPKKIEFLEDSDSE